MDEGRTRELLRLAREQIQASLDDLAEPEDREQLQDREVEEGLTERLRDELAAIERAEERIRQGRYGVSIESGEPIPDARLEAIPWAERTAQEEERR